MLERHNPEPSLFSKRRGVFNISEVGLVEIIKAVFEKGFLLRFSAKGISMSPFIKDGDVITISQISNTKAQFGDIVAYIIPGDIIVVSVDTYTYLGVRDVVI